MNIKALDKKLIKQSTIRVVKCGSIIEKYEYATPYFYNFGKTASSNVPEKETGIDESRTDNIERARRKIKRLINSNVFVYGFHPIFVTYTFAENITNVRQANAFFKKHHDNLRRRIVGRSVRYLAVPEFQKRGAVHYHAVYFDLPFISGIKDIFASSWGQGYVQIKAVKHVKNIGAYVSKYFSKNWFERKDKGAKCYFSTDGLFQPETLHGIKALDFMEGAGIMTLEHEQTFFSDKYGQIHYQQLKLSQIYANSSNYSKSREPSLQRKRRDAKELV